MPGSNGGEGLSLYAMLLALQKNGLATLGDRMVDQMNHWSDSAVFLCSYGLVVFYYEVILFGSWHLEANQAYFCVVLAVTVNQIIKEGKPQVERQAASS